MAVSAMHPTVTIDLSSWQADVAQLLEEHHLVAWGASERQRVRFGLGMAEYLRKLPDTELWFLHGQQIRDVESFCHQLERLLPGAAAPRVARSVDGPGGIVERLRSRWVAPGAAPPKTRYYLWQDAHILLRRDHRLFGRLVDAIAGIAAEAEYASEDRLLIHRAMFIGAPSLDAYADDPKGQFRCWLREDHERALWEVISGLTRPPVLRYRIAQQD